MGRFGESRYADNNKSNLATSHILESGAYTNLVQKTPSSCGQLVHLVSAMELCGEP